MKFIISVILIATIISCETNTNKVEVIPDYDEVYLPPSKVDIPVDIIGDESSQLDDIEEIIGRHYQPQKDAYYFFRATMLINEGGKLEKIKYSKVTPGKNFKAAEINPNIDELFPKLTDYLIEMEFTPGILNDEKVKSQFIWEGSFRTDSDGIAEFYLGSLEMKGLSGLSRFNSKEYKDKVDEMPKPIGGIGAIQEKIRYPQLAVKAGIQGRVYVKAFIDEVGTVTEVEIIRGLDGGCSEAALEAVKATKFEPGRENGKPVKVQVSIPILFKLN